MSEMWLLSLSYVRGGCVFCISLLRFCVLANEYFLIVHMRITFCWNSQYMNMKLAASDAERLLGLKLFQVLQYNFQSVAQLQPV